MSKTSLMILPQFLEQAASLQKDMKSKLLKALWLLSEYFRHPSLQCKKVEGSKATLYECRVDQSIRLIYDVAGGVLRCWYVGEHDAALRFAASSKPSAEVIVDDIEIRTVEQDAKVSEQLLDYEELEASMLTSDLESLRSRLTT